jgi:D-galactarolactone cycloisomerase
MRIARLTAHPLEASFARLFGGADKVPDSVKRPAAHFQTIVRAGQYATLVAIEDSEGNVGVGESFGLPHPSATADLIAHVAEPALRGREVDDPAAALRDLTRYFSALGHVAGPAMEALAGIDIALWDLKAKRAKRPLADELGAKPRPIPTYVSPVPFLPHPEDSGAAAAAWIAKGFRALKLKIGRGVATDLAHIRAVRGAIPRECALMLDANCAYDVATAIELARALDPAQVRWLEEPVPPDDPAWTAAVRAASPVPVAAGENAFALAQFEALIRARAVDVLMPNIGRALGVSGLMAIGARAVDAGVRVSPHGVGGAVAVAACVQLCAALPGFDLFEVNALPNPLRDAMLGAPFRTENGAILPLDGPGHGAAPKRDFVDSYRWRNGRAEAPWPL